MENETQYKKIYLFNPRYKTKNRIILLSLLVVFASLIISYETSVYQLQQKQIKLAALKKQTTQDSTSSPKFDYTDIGLKSASCLINNTSPSLSQIWLLSQLYTQFKDNKYIDYINQNLPKIKLDNDFPFICKFGSELALNPNINIDQKENLKQLCLESDHSKDINRLVFQFNKSSNQDSISQIFQNKSAFKKQIIEEFKAETDITTLSNLAKESIGIYNYNNQELDLLNSKILFTQALKNYFQQENWTYPQVCLLGDLSLDLYQIDKQKIYLDIAKDLISQVQPITKLKKLNLFSQAHCAQFSSHLYQLNKNPVAKTLHFYLLDQAINSNHQPETNCFYSQEVDTLLKPELENALLSNSLIKINEIEK